jgi:hypothetical protein
MASAKTSNWTGGRVAAMICASFAALIGLALLLVGLVLIGLHGFARDDDGYYTSDRESLRSNGYAITTDEINLGADVAEDIPDDLLGTLRVSAVGAGGRSIFLGIGPTADVQRYLGRVAHSELTDFSHGRAVLEQVPGRAPTAPPSAQSFWVAESEGTGERRIDWDPEAGVWTVAVLNADTARGVAVDAEIGAKVNWLIWAGIAALVVGLVLAATGVILILVIGRRASRDRVEAPSRPGEPGNA